MDVERNSLVIPIYRRITQKAENIIYDWKTPLNNESFKTQITDIRVPLYNINGCVRDCQEFRSVRVLTL